MGSVGQGRVREYHVAIPLAISNAEAVPNTSGLCSLSHTSCGIAVTRPASAAPAPSATRIAGSTQQTSVPALLSKVAADRITLRVKADVGLVTALSAPSDCELHQSVYRCARL